MADISKITLPNGQNYDLKDRNKSGVYHVFGTQTASTNKFTGALHGVPALYDGLTIAYYLPYDGTGSSATLNLTLDSGSTTGAIAIYYKNGATRLTTHYGAGSMIIMTYYSAGSISVDGTSTTTNHWHCAADYNSNTTNTAGATDTSSKIYLVGAETQAANPQTYTQDTIYAGTDGCVYSNDKRVVDIAVSATQPTGQVNGDIWLEIVS